MTLPIKKLQRKMINPNIREDFPILKRQIQGNTIIYLDNAATTQKPKQVISKITEYYETSNSNIHRGIYQISEESTQQYDEARQTVAELINAKEEEIIFTKNTTDSLNTIVRMLEAEIKEGDEIVIGENEHHSSLIPLQQLAKRKNAKLKILEINENGEPTNLEIINNKTKILSLNLISNFTGILNKITPALEKAKENGAYTIVDLAQTIPHMKVDVTKEKIDFAAFSGHKMLGPQGIGVLYGRKELLESLPPVNFGGGMIKNVEYENSEWDELPFKFEAGTPDIEGAIGLSTAIKYLEKIGFENILKHTQELAKYMHEKLQEIPQIKIHTTPNSILNNFNIENLHPHDIATLLDKKGICVRPGYHCVMPYMKKQNIEPTIRTSYYIYNTKEEIDKVIEELKNIITKL